MFLPIFCILISNCKIHKIKGTQKNNNVTVKMTADFKIYSKWSLLQYISAIMVISGDLSWQDNV